MPQIQVNSTNINSFGFSVSFDLYNRQITFDTSSTVYNGGGIANVHGIAFSLVDSVGLELMGVDWTAPQIVPSVSQTYVLDLTTSPVQFLLQNYTIIGYIQEADGTVYYTIPVLKTVCQPNGLNESGYVDGMFQIIPDCLNNVLTVKEFTVMTYSNLTPLSVSKTGTLYYPTGTISPIQFTSTPFSNNVIFTGEYMIRCVTVATYDLLDNVYVLVSYVTNKPFPITCANFIGNIICCLTEVYNTYLTNCENAIGQAALQKYNSILPIFLNGFAKQVNGQDSSSEVALIKKQLNCNCGNTSVLQNESTPINPAIYSIVLNGKGGTTVLPAYIIGSTQVFNIASNAYVVGKGNLGDLAFIITQDTSVQNVVTYKITFNYDIEAGYILNAIQANPTWINQLNSLVTGSGGSIAGLDGGCVIDLTTANYAMSQAVTSNTLVSSMTINGVIHNAPTNLFGNDATGVASWLNSLSLGTFTAVVVSGILTIQSVENANKIATITFTLPNVTVQFSSTNSTLLQVLQAIIDYLCGLTALQVELGNNLSLCTFDYNGNVITSSFASGASQSVFNSGVASSICNLAARISNVTGLTCNSLKALFIDSPSVQFGANGRVYGSLDGVNCAGMTDQQIANLVIAAVGKYSDVKAAWCAIDCTAPSSCPDVSNTNLSMSGNNIGVYGLTWLSTPIASQTITVRYRVTGTPTWTTATNALVILPNGNISGTSPYLITGVSVGTTYDVQLQNNCGGIGFIKQITTPTGSVYVGSYYLDNIIYNICGETPVTLYSSQPFASGVTMFTDIGLTNRVTGYTYITKNGNNIFGLNTSSGVVGVDTGTACANGTPGTYVLGNNTGTICGLTPLTLYTNGAFGVGVVLFQDMALTMPQTGFSYVVNQATNIIYNLNSSTGAVGSSTGLNCTGTATLTFSFSNLSGGSYLSFNALLNRTIDANVVVSRMYVDGFSDSGCITNVASAQKNTSATINTGFSGFSVTPDLTTGTWASAIKSSIYNVIVNGVSVVGGSTVVIGSYSVSIIINTCS